MKQTPDQTRKTGEHLMAYGGGFPRCVTCGADEDTAYVGGERCSYKRPRIYKKRPVLRFRHRTGFRDATDYIECKHGRTYLVYKDGTRYKPDYWNLERCREMVRNGSWVMYSDE